MDYKVLYRKYRPLDFDNVVGQDYIVKTLKKAIINEKNSHAYIFTGPRGTGKTSVAKIFSKAINCEKNIDGNPCATCNSCINIDANADVIEIDAASNNGVDEIREIINNIHLTPSYSKYKVYIIDEVHMLSTSAFNALLLTLEEPPPYVIFILATTEIQSVPITVLSRCQRYDFKKIPTTILVERLKTVTKKEKIKITEEALEEIAYISDGALRDALSILDQLVDKDNKNITIEDVIEVFGTISTKSVKDLIKYLELGKAKEVVKHLNEVNDTGVNFKIYCSKLIEQLKEKAVKQKVNNENSILDYETIKKLIFELNDCLNNIKNNTNPYLLIELILMGYINEEITSEVTLPPSKEVLQPEQHTEEEKEIDKQKTLEMPVINPKKIKEEPEVKTENLNTPNEDFIKVRINNCFVGAKKEFLTELKELWKNLLIDLKNDNKHLFGVLVDSEIVAASNDYAIITVANESTAHLINEELENISKYIEDKYKKKYKFISINNDVWKSEKTQYASKIKKGFKYELLEEKKIKPVKEEKATELMAKNIFGAKLEIK